MNENFLHFVWKHKLFASEHLLSASGEQIEVLSTGFHNRDAGPDFFNARIRIGETTWAGNVEIHWKASEWMAHRHEKDSAYDNVILHVVKENDKPVVNSKGDPVECVCLQYPEKLEQNYGDLLQSEEWISCASQIAGVNQLELQIWFHSLMVERLESKTREIEQQLEQNKNDWNEVFYQFLARNFGFKVNALPFEMLAKSVPLGVLAKHKNNLFQLEALLFGSAGLLHDELIGDDYFLALREEYFFLSKKYRLKSVQPHLWKFLRLRPVNFPTVRIAQFAKLIHQSTALFSHLTEMTSLDEIRRLFMIEPSAYWANHYRFNKESRKSSKAFGASSFHNIVINTLVPFLFVYGEMQQRENLKNRALEYLDQIPPEQNSILKNWQQLGISARSAFDSQALIQLKNAYCNGKKCLNCPVGIKLIKGTRHKENESVNE